MTTARRRAGTSTTTPSIVGGTQTSGANNTFAFNSTGTTNARTFQNNIFVNARSNSGGTGKHYAVQYGGTTVNPPGLTAGGNLFLASGTGGVLGRLQQHRPHHPRRVAGRDRAGRHQRGGATRSL